MFAFNTFPRFDVRSLNANLVYSILVAANLRFVCVPAGNSRSILAHPNQLPLNPQSLAFAIQSSIVCLAIFLFFGVNIYESPQYQRVLPLLRWSAIPRTLINNNLSAVIHYIHSDAATTTNFGTLIISIVYIFVQSMIRLSYQCHGALNLEFCYRQKSEFMSWKLSTLDDLDASTSGKSLRIT